MMSARYTMRNPGGLASPSRRMECCLSPATIVIVRSDATLKHTAAAMAAVCLQDLYVANYEHLSGALVKLTASFEVALYRRKERAK